MAALLRLPLQITPTADLAADALQRAITYSISAYDACYVALAQHQAVPLITADQKLANKFVGVIPAVVWLGTRSPPP